MAVKVDLNGIKEQIQTLLDSANTTTASPIDLSSGLANSVRVQKVLKVHPEMIPIQASFYPCVTCYIPNKIIKTEDMASDQLNAKRRSTVNVEIVGAVWNSTFSTVDEDPADEDINNLMENIELILRSNHTLNNKVRWQKPGDVNYYIAPIDEQTHLRAGTLSLQCEIWY